MKNNNMVLSDEERIEMEAQILGGRCYICGRSAEEVADYFELDDDEPAMTIEVALGRYIALCPACNELTDANAWIDDRIKHHTFEMLEDIISVLKTKQNE